MLDVLASRELTAAVAALDQADRTLRADINKVARAELSAEWRDELRTRAHSLLEQRALLPGARVRVSARQITLVAAASKKPLTGGLVPTDEWPAVEFGARNKRKTVQLRSPKGKRYPATRMQGKQFRNRSRHGYVVFPSAAAAGRRIVAGWVHVVIAGFEADFEVHR